VDSSSHKTKRCLSWDVCSWTGHKSVTLWLLFLLTISGDQKDVYIVAQEEYSIASSEVVFP